MNQEWENYLASQEDRNLIDLAQLKNDYNRAEFLQNLIISALNIPIQDIKDEDNLRYQILRRYFVLHKKNKYKKFPDFLKDKLDLRHCLSFIYGFFNNNFNSEYDYRDYIWDSFSPFLQEIEEEVLSPPLKEISVVLKKYSPDVHNLWLKAWERKNTDPNGAVTIAKALLESVFKNILDEYSIPYDKDVIFTQLYTMASKVLKLNGSQYEDEPIIKKILSGCTSIVSGVNELRNGYSDAHGQGKNPKKASPRHAGLVVNLAGVMSAFFVETLEEKKKKEKNLEKADV